MSASQIRSTEDVSFACKVGGDLLRGSWGNWGTLSTLCDSTIQYNTTTPLDMTQ